MADATVAVPDQDPYGLQKYRESLVGLSHRQLLEEYGRTEAFTGVFSNRSAAIRDVAKQRALAELAKEGVKPRWEAVGVASLSVTGATGQPLVVTDRAALGSWTAQHFPTEAFASLEVESPDLPRALEVLEQAGVKFRKATVEPRDAFVKNVLLKTNSKGQPVNVEVIRVPQVDEAGQPVVDEDGAQIINVSVHLLKTGVLIDGLGVGEPKEPNVQIRVDEKAKIKAQQEVTAAALRAYGAGPVAVERAEPFGTVVADPAPAVEADGWADVADDGALEEAGEPYDPPCKSKVQGGLCGIPESAHSGRLNQGGYKPTGCKRFREKPAS